MKLANETFLPCFLCPLLVIQAKDYRVSRSQQLPVSQQHLRELPVSQPHPAFPQPVAPVLPCRSDSSCSSAGLLSRSPQECSSHLTWQPLVFTSQFLSVAPPLPPLAPPQLLGHSKGARSPLGGGARAAPAVLPAASALQLPSDLPALPEPPCQLLQAGEQRGEFPARPGSKRTAVLFHTPINRFPPCPRSFRLPPETVQKQQVGLACDRGEGFQTPPQA